MRACDVTRRVAVWPASFSTEAPRPSAIESPPTQICNGCSAVGVRSGGIVVVVGAATVVDGGGAAVAGTPVTRNAAGGIDVVGRGVVGGRGGRGGVVGVGTAVAAGG